MNFKELLEAATKTIYTLKDAWDIKLAASFLFSLITGFFTSKVGIILMLFFGLVLLDLFTRWIALSKKSLDDSGAEFKSLWACICNLPKARRDGYIQSSPMKHRFAGKFISYMLMCALAALLDSHIQVFGDNGGFVKLFVIYMGISEGMSILENLQEAGVEQASGLLDIIKSKRQGLR